MYMHAQGVVSQWVASDIESYAARRDGRSGWCFHSNMFEKINVRNMFVGKVVVQLTPTVYTSFPWISPVEVASAKLAQSMEIQ